MAIASVEKKHKQSIKRRLRNRVAISRVKTSMKKAEEALTAKEPETAQKELKAAYSIIDHSASQGILHKNNAARKKSQLMKLYNSLSAQSSPKKKEKSEASPKA